MLRRVVSLRGASVSALQAPMRTFSTENQSTGESKKATEDKPAIEIPLVTHQRHQHKRFQMPFPRGEAWGQVLVKNSELPVPTGTWTAQSRRAGLVCRKIGMMMTYTQVGTRIALSVLEVDNCQVVNVNHQQDKNGNIRLEMGCTDRKEKNVPKQRLGHFHRARVHPKQHLATMKISPDSVLPIGWRMDPRHFTPGQYVNVWGTSLGKGFAGVMKRYHFGGQPASHGVSVSHRSLGSTGQNQFPGHVFKNKKMPGRMGGERTFVRNMQVYKVDPKRNLLFIAGPVPGPTNGMIELMDADWKPFNPETPPPFPTFVPAENDAMEEIVLSRELLGEDPFAGGAV